MAYKTGFVKNYKDLLLALKDFIDNEKKAFNVIPNVNNVGNGYISTERVVDDSSAGAPDETWTLVATSATNFTVTGSVSGSQTAATVGTPYDNAIIAFEIVVGGIAFQADDSFTFEVADGLSTQKWTINRWDTSSEYEMLAMGPGSAGDDAIYVGIQTFSSSVDYHCWRLNGFTGYQSESLFMNQPGAIQDTPPLMLLWNAKIAYWFVASGRRIVIVARLGTIYEAAYLGLYLGYGTPAALPYPLAIGGSSCAAGLALSDYQYTNQDPNHKCFVDPNGVTDGSYCTLRVLHGSWLGFANFDLNDYVVVALRNLVWPYNYGNMYSFTTNYAYTRYRVLQKNLDDSLSLFPLILMNGNPSGGNVLGELDGCKAVPAPNASAEDTIVDGSDTYVLFSNVFRSWSYDYWALKLE